MGELDAYTGPFNPDLQLTDFSKGLLVRLMAEWTKAYLWQDEFWRIEAEKRISPQECLDCETAVWINLAKRVMPRVARAAGIEVRNAVDVCKAMQLPPDSTLVSRAFQTTFEVKDENHVIATVTHCGPLEFFEKQAPERIESFCHVADPRIMQAYVESLLPGATVVPLKLPPRKSKEDIACIWEYRS